MGALKKIALVTGSAGFIGFHVTLRLLKDGWTVIGVDSISDYYDVSLKHSREQILLEMPQYKSVHASIETPDLLKNLFSVHRPEIVYHFAAQAGVRNSITNPNAYMESNVIGTFQLLEAARCFPPAHLLLASTSSVYGENEKIPFCESDRTDFQISLYAATKKSSEVLAHSYAHLFNIPITIMRFFTVYGPWGRPDMALFKFADAIIRGMPIDLYNYGDMQRDFTYIDDLVVAMKLLINLPPAPRTDNSDGLDRHHSRLAPYRIVNIGASRPIGLLDFVSEIESALNKISVKNMMPMQKADVSTTWSDTSFLNHLIGSRRATPLREGIVKFVDWYRLHYNIE